jgi:hypothetical protein
VAAALRAGLPERLAGALLEAAGVEPGRLPAELRRDERIRLIDTLVRGELLDAFGPIGGFNFRWAWATGRAAGFGAAQVVSGPPRVRNPRPSTASSGR